MRKFFSSPKILVGHNICRYDIPALEKILGISITLPRYDTLALSWYLFPNRNEHGLDLWGQTYGIEKPKIDDWENLSSEEYIHRCEQDVRINQRLWDDVLGFLRQLYSDEEEVTRALVFVSNKLDRAALQEACRWKLDIPKCIAGRDQLLADREERIRQLKEIMPKVPKVTTRKRPSKCYKQSGELSSKGGEWFKLLNEGRLAPDTQEVKVISAYLDPNPGSHQQVKDFLSSLGWKPDEYKYVKDEGSDKPRAIPQINKQTPGENGVTESVKRLIEKNPKLDALDGLYVINHRLGILEGMLENVDEEGYLRAEVGGLTNTLRYQHRVLVNLPRPDKPYGELIRGCLIAPEGMLLCGSDMSGLEDKIKQHFIYDHDPDYVQRMQREDYDPHLTLAVFAKAVTDQEYQGYMDKVPEVVSKIKPIRSIYKNGNYALKVAHIKLCELRGRLEQFILSQVK